MDAQDVNSQAGSSTSTSTYPVAPTFDFSDPRDVTTWPASGIDSEVDFNFFRYARWCPDGTSILTTAEDRVIRVFDSPADADPKSARPFRSFSQPDAIHSTAWYPTASTAHPETFVFLASVRDAPVRMVDALDGRVRATYPIVDHRERFIAPHSLAFNPSATKVYCGHENAIEVLDIAAPGHNNSERIKTTQTKREKGGQKGIISSLAFCTDYSGLYAAGSFSGQVSLYQEDAKGAVMHLEEITGGGVTQLQFHPLSPNHLFVSSRRSTHLQVYDLRDPTAPFCTLERKGTTNQRLSFDVDPWGRYIFSGDEDGNVKGWDISSLPAGGDIKPVFERKLHEGAVGSVQLHPFQPLLLTAAGSRSYLTGAGASRLSNGSIDSESDSDSDGDSSAEETEDGNETMHGERSGLVDDSQHARADRRPAPSRDSRRPADTALRIWSLSPVPSIT